MCYKEFQALVIAIVLLYLIGLSTGRLSTRCFVCRSRGDLGDCRDPFNYNDTSIKDLPGNPLSVTPCSSGWCHKQTEGIRGPADEYGSATERFCMSQAPSDGEERCAEVKIRNKISLLCFCRGDLCNTSSNLFFSITMLVPLSFVPFFVFSF